MKELLKRHLISVSILVILGVALFYPILPDLAHRISGDLAALNAKDGYQNVWNFWWAHKNCLGFCGNMGQTDFQFYPVGTSLLFETWAYPSLYLFTPMMFLGMSAVTAFNVAIIFAVVTALVSAYALVLHLTKKRSAAFIGGLIYGLSPFLIGHVLDGQLNLTNIQFFPLFLLFLLKSKEEKGNIFKVLTGLTLLLLGLNDYVFLIIALIVWGIYLVYLLSTKQAKFSEILKKNLLILVIFLAPFCLLSYNNFKNFSSFELKGKTRWDANYSSTNLASFVTPPNYTLIGNRYFNESYKKINGIFSDKTVYVGLVPLLLSAFGLFYIRKRKEIWLWISLGLTGVIFSLGPKLHYFGEVKNFWLPFRMLETIPIINIIRAPSRFTVVMYLSLAVLAGYGLTLFSEHLKSKNTYLILTILVAILVTIEFCPFNLPETDLYVPIGYQEIIKDKTDFAIIEAPALWMSGLKNASQYYPIESLYFQTVHQKKMANGYVTRLPKDQMELYSETPILRFIIDQSNNTALSEDAQSIIKRYKDYYIKNILSDNPYKYLVIIKGPGWTTLNNQVKLTLKDKIELYYKDAEIEIYTFKK